MVDVLNIEQRRFCMSRVKGKNTQPELKLRKALWASGLRYRLGYKLPGKPDLVFVSARTVVFVDGCFWHNCPIHGGIPKTNKSFWTEKISKNVIRDKKVNSELKELGWHVLRYWEHDIKKDLKSCTVKIIKQVKNQDDPSTTV